MPADVVDRLNAEVRQILQLPDVRERLRPDGIEPNALDPKAFTDFMSPRSNAGRRWCAPPARAPTRG